MVGGILWKTSAGSESSLDAALMDLAGQLVYLSG
jgi:hypothetical protein